MSKKTNLLMLVSTLLISSIGCSTNKQAQKVDPEGVTGSGPKNCTLEQVTFNAVVSGFDQSQTLDVIAKLQAAAHADYEAVKAGGSINVQFGTAFNEVVKTTTQKRFSISQDTANTAVLLRRLGCDVQAGLFDGANRDTALKQYLTILDRLSQLKQDPGKGNQSSP